MADYTIKYRIGVDTGNAAENLDRVSRSGEKADKAMKQVANAASGGSGSAAYALTNFNRVIQDAPYGVMGVANNIDPLVSSFQKLKAETGSNSAAMKALLGTLSGPTGMLFGVNALILGIQVLPGLFQKISSAASGTSEKMKELTNATKAVAILSNESITKNLGQAKALQVLGDQLKKTNANSAERKKLIEQIKAINPEFVKGINLNTASEKELTKWLTNSMNAIREKVKAQLTEIFLAPYYAKIAEQYQKYNEALDDFTNAQKRKNIEGVRMQMGGSDPMQSGAYRDFVTVYEDAAVKLNKALANLNAAVSSNDMKTALSSAESFATMLFGPAKTTTGTTTPSGKSGDNTVDRLIRPVQDTVEQFIEQALEEWRDGWLKRGEGEDLLNAAIPGQKLGILVALEAVEAKGYDIEKMMGNLNLSFDEFTGFSVKIERGFDSAFDNLSTSLTDAIWGYERLDLVGQKFLNTLAQMVIQTIILSAIQAGIGALFGPIGMSGWIQKNIFGVDAVGGRSLTGGIGISTGEMNLLRNISRQTLNLGGELKLRASGNDLKGVLKAEDLFRGSNR